MAQIVARPGFDPANTFACDVEERADLFEHMPLPSLSKRFNIGEVFVSPYCTLVANEMLTADIMDRDAAVGS